MPCDFFTQAILPYLTPDQIDEMGFYNRGLSQLISRNRVNLPRAPIRALEIHGSEKKIIYDISDDVVSINVVDDNYMVHIKHLQPKCLDLIGDVQFEHLDERWLKTINTVLFDEIDEEIEDEDFHRIIQRFNSPKVRIYNECVHLDAGKILETMPSLTVLEMKSVSIPATFFEEVVRKSKIGEGIRRISLENEMDSPFDAGQLVHIIENAKFKAPPANSLNGGNNSIAIDFVTGTHHQFVEKLTELTRKMGWNMMFEDHFAHFFRIIMQFSSLSVKIQLCIE